MLSRSAGRVPRFWGPVSVAFERVRVSWKEIQAERVF